MTEENQPDIVDWQSLTRTDLIMMEKKIIASGNLPDWGKIDIPIDGDSRRPIMTWHSWIWSLARSAAIRSDRKNAEKFGATTSIVMSFMAIETCIAEVIAVVMREKDDQNLPPLGQMLRELVDAKERIVVKILLLGHVFPDSYGSSYDKGKDPIQSLMLLKDLRNLVMHPEVYVDKTPKFLKWFEDQDLTHDPFWSFKTVSKHPTPWIEQVSTPMIARWACETARKLVDDLSDRMTLSSNQTISEFGRSALGWAKCNDPFSWASEVFDTK